MRRVRIRKSFEKPFTTVILSKQIAHPEQVRGVLNVAIKPTTKTGVIIISQIFKKLNGNNVIRNTEPII